MIELTPDILAGGIVSIAVGPEGYPFDVHVELLCAHSPYLDQALEDRFEEAGTLYLTLEDDDPKLFTRAVSWMYSGRLGVSILDKSTTWKLLCDLWLLADKYQIIELQNHMIDTLKHKYSVLSEKERCNFAPSLVSDIYQRTPPSSQLRRAVTCMAVWAMDGDHFRKHYASFPREFREDKEKEQMRRTNELLSNKMPLAWATHTFYVEAPGYESSPSTPTTMTSPDKASTATNSNKTPVTSRGPAQDPMAETLATLQERVATLEKQLAFKNHSLAVIGTAASRAIENKPFSKGSSASAGVSNTTATSARKIQSLPTPPSSPPSAVDDLADLLEAL
ncbi:hypothetical protein P171DRAFT_16283 [Karstenula rhodostoma CBS 690.94]|uniref:BTB domain-containing protein n=1 Tax=Karstenula rhodostoma CBS 690.94 TaxID=1392251 RepID=A0A9P4UJA7_9PLEO|nr:hypothetical protein P171DRAFT_16283 [Karstenula rhodostoma CBS 690.94]